MDLLRRFTVAALVVLGWHLFTFEYAAALEIQGQIQANLANLESKMVVIKKKPYEGFPDQIPSRSLEISPEGGVQNAVVMLEGDLPRINGSVKKAVILDQRDYRFEPHILLVRSGEPFMIRNSDSMAHDIRAFDNHANMIFQFEMDGGQAPVEKRFVEDGIYTLRCGLHRWMYAFVISTPHHFVTITDEEGKFALKGVAPGRYQVRVWHETLGELEMPLNLTESIYNFDSTFKSP